MNKLKLRTGLALLVVFAVFLLHECQLYKKASVPVQPVASQPTVPAKVDLESSPVITAASSIAMMKVEEGFEVKLVAAEPLISAPVAMTFDSRGRIWVLEMNGYMPDTLGTGEDKPTGKVVILEDRDKDGVADERKVFLDSLKLPRAICLIDSGILVAEPPYLWFYEMKGDKPGKKTLVDSKYADEGNVEHQPNGLLRALDNWIYNAKSGKRYRRAGNGWIIEKTHFRGQWGISQDDYGRLYYNDNSTNLRGDYFTPGLGIGNKNQQGVSGYVERTVADNRVYPIRPTPGVNRGYVPGVLDDSLRLVNFTAACGPLVYRGNLFGAAYEMNAFVAEPSANLVKRNILKETGYVVRGEQAYKNKEFLASTDERFRPVSLYDAPDGALYIVDMYRGILQHKTYLTPYLKKEIGRRELTEPLACGRIYKIVPKNKPTAQVVFPNDPSKLVQLLGHPNGWVRDKAQQIIVDRKTRDVEPDLRNGLLQSNDPHFLSHALWTLEGLHALQTGDVLALLKHPAWPVRMQALSVLPSVITGKTYQQYLAALQQLIDQDDTLAAPYVAFLAKSIQPFDKAASNNLLTALVRKNSGNRFVADAVISSLEDREEAFKQQVTAFLPDTTLAFHRELRQVIVSIQNTRKNHDPLVLQKEFPKGAAIFSTTCQTCHGPDGNGIKFLAPPLNKSEWVTGDKDKVISIVLFGLTGPVTVNGHVYQAPEINADMPGIGFTKELTDKDIAEVLSYIRRSWQNNGTRITAQDVTRIRTKLAGREKALTVKELEEMYVDSSN